MQSPSVKIPDGWERLPSDEVLAVGDKYWHPWHLRFNEVETTNHAGTTVKSYEEYGAIVIRKKEPTQ